MSHLGINVHKKTTISALEYLVIDTKIIVIAGIEARIWSFDGLQPPSWRPFWIFVFIYYFEYLFRFILSRSRRYHMDNKKHRVHNIYVLQCVIPDQWWLQKFKYCISWAFWELWRHKDVISLHFNSSYRLLCSLFHILSNDIKLIMVSYVLVHLVGILNKHISPTSVYFQVFCSQTGSRK